MLVITYYTPGPYAEAARRLVASGQRHGVKVVATGTPDLGAWWRNVALKPGLISAALLENQPVLYLDADCEIVAPLGAMEVPNAMVGVFMRRRGAPDAEPNAGVMLLLPGQDTERFVHTWDNLAREKCHRYETGDQALILEAARLTDTRIGDLPDAYNAMPADDRAGALIVHNKASRDDPALSSWKTARRLERLLVRRTAQLVSTRTAETVRLVGTSASHTLGRSPVFETHSVGWAADGVVSWVDSFADLRPNPKGRLTVAPTAVAGLTTVDAMRYYYKPKPHAGEVPPGVALYYPTASPRPDSDGEELSGAGSWGAAVHCAALRGAREIIVDGCPDTLLPLVCDTARELGVSVTLPPVRRK